MSISSDIALVLDEVGTRVNITRPDGTSFIEKIDLYTPSRVSHPFIREFLSEATFRSSTKIVSGDIIEVVASGLIYMVLSIVPDYFEDEVTENTAFLYKCNKEGIILYGADADQRDDRYRSELRWEPVYENMVPVLLYDKQAFDRAITLHERWGQLAVTSNELYISGFYIAPVLSRLRLFSIPVDWTIWDSGSTYSLNQTVISDDDYKAFKSLVNSNNEILTEISAWQEIPYRDMKIERVDLSRFDNVFVYNAIEDMR